MSFTIRFGILLIVALFLKSCVISNPKPEDCEIIEITSVRIYEGGIKDIVFEADNGSIYYINRGLEQGFTLAGMEDRVLNKKVILHLAKTITGTTAHIAQLALEDEIIFTEFK